jgi:pentachlorophenol monooxygenase
MRRKRQTEVLVVGAGPVGLLAANHLVERGVEVAVVDEEWRPAARSYALALHSRSLELLDEIGIAAELLERGHRIRRVAFYDRETRRAEISLVDLLPGAFPFVLVLPQDVLEEELEDCLARHRVRVRWNHRLAALAADDDPPTASVERLGKESTGYGVATTVWVVEKEETYTARYVVGADGHRSMVRRALGVELEPVGPSDLYAVFEIRTDAEDLDEARVVLDGGTTSVLWPLGGGRVRWSFQVAGEEGVMPASARPDKSRLSFLVGRQAFPFLSRESLLDRIAERAPWFEGEILDVPWSAGVRFERRLASRFGRGGAWLAGDAAHLAPPVGNHSINRGLLEARTLAERMAGIVRGEGAPERLEEYAAEARDEWRRLLGVDGRVEADESASDWVRERAAAIVSCLPATGRDLGLLAGGLGLRLA